MRPPIPGPLEAPLRSLEKIRAHYCYPLKERPVALQPALPQLDHKPQRRQPSEPVVPGSCVPNLLARAIPAHQLPGICFAVLVHKIKCDTLLGLQIADEDRLGDRPIACSARKSQIHRRERGPAQRQTHPNRLIRICNYRIIKRVASPGSHCGRQLRSRANSLPSRLLFPENQEAPTGLGRHGIGCRHAQKLPPAHSSR